MFANVIPLRRMPRELQTLTYAVPENIAQKLMPGQLVKIPLFKHEEYGIIQNFTKALSEVDKNIKSIISILNEVPALSKGQLKFIEEISALYSCPLGLLTKSNLFALQKKKLHIFENSNLGTVTSTIKKAVCKKFLEIYQNEDDKISYLLKKISPDGQNLIIVPEISYIQNLNTALSQNFEGKMCTISSNTKPKEYFEIWQKLHEKKINIILGTRRSFFLPWENIENIFLIDEPHPSHKNSEATPRIHSRDASFIMASIYGANLHFLTHTPSVEVYSTFKNKDTGQIAAAVELKPFIAPSGPSTHLVDMSEERRAKNFNALSNLAQKKIAESFIKKDSIFFFLNSRGSFKQVACSDCTHVFSCETCKLALSYHQVSKKLFCHRCQKKYSLPAVCPECGNAQFKMFGIGTQALEEQIKKIIPREYAFLRIDQDMESPKAIDFKSPFIIVGTQFAWEKIDWKKIKLFIWVNADSAFYISEYKTTENIWFQLRSASYRLPRESQQIIQTSHPQHYVFQSLQLPKEFYVKELKTREKYNYPPYSFVIKLSFAENLSEKSSLEATKTYQLLLKLTKSEPSIKIYSPISPNPAYYKNKYWTVIIVKIIEKNPWVTAKKIINHIPSGCKVDLNPENLLNQS